MNIEILIQNGSIIYSPLVKEGIEWTTERKGAPGRLTFSVLKDDIINFTEGNSVRMSVDGQKIFYGFVFTKKRTKGDFIEVTAYDQLRYLKNKDTYVYTNKTASDVVKMIAADFGLNLGTIEQTSFVIPSRCEADTSLFDIIYTALDLELTNKNNMFVLYDDCGKLTLKSLEQMKTEILIDDTTALDFDYTSTIDEQTYNVIKYAYTGDQTSGIEVVFAPQLTYENGKKALTENQKQWGVLQYFLKEDNIVMNRVQAQEKANSLLSLYNTKTRNLKIADALGNLNIRAGNMPVVKLDLGDILVQNRFLVEKCTHKFKESEHFMDLILRGGEFL